MFFFRDIGRTEQGNQNVVFFACGLEEAGDGATIETGIFCQLQGAYEQIAEAVRGSPQVVADETGWRIDGDTGWLHVFVGLRETYYTIEPTRSGEPARKLLVSKATLSSDNPTT